MTRIAGLGWLGIAGLVSLVPATFAQNAPVTERPPTYAIDYVVSVDRESPSRVRARWNLAGIEELTRVRIELDGDRFYDFAGSGKLRQEEKHVDWSPGGPYGHLEYKARLRHQRSEGKGYDSYSHRDWIITRAQDLFPRHHVSYETELEPAPRSRSSVEFRLPRGWRAWSPMEEVAPSRFRPDRTDGVLDRPKGWLGLGRLEESSRRIAGVQVTIVKPRGSGFDSRGALEIYERGLPPLVEILGTAIPRLLVVSGPDPMWRGGLSGERSLFLHEGRPLRTPDQTTPLLHEAFHVLASFSPGREGRWITEGLAELYSLTLQHRTKLISDEAYRKGLRSFLRHGKWNRNLVTDTSLAITNNSAPAVIAAIDELIRKRTKGERSLDDVVQQLARNGGHVNTAKFLRAVKQSTGSDLTSFFQRHVYAGEPPHLASLNGSGSGKALEKAPRPSSSP